MNEKRTDVSLDQIDPIAPGAEQIDERGIAQKRSKTRDKGCDKATAAALSKRVDKAKPKA